MKTSILGSVFAGLITIVSLTAQAAPILPLEGRLETAPGSGVFQAYYDPNINATWLADANLAASNTFGVTGIDTNGRMSWYTAFDWIAAMNASNYLGFNNWRLPSFDGNGNGIIEIYGYCFYSGPGSSCADNEMNFLRWQQHISFQGSGYYSTASAPFINMYRYYWSDADLGTSGYIYDFDSGTSLTGSKKFRLGAVWAVRTGDILTTVPEPTAIWLTGLGLIGVLAAARLKHNSEPAQHRLYLS